jgi:predicted nucleotidyltransferase
MNGERRRQALERLCRERGVLAAYLFGSRADDGMRWLDGATVPEAGSDLDIGIVEAEPDSDLDRLVRLDVALTRLFAPLRLDVVPARRVDALFQLRIIDGHRIFAANSTAADLYELLVFRRAADLLPRQRARELELFGVSTS